MAHTWSEAFWVLQALRPGTPRASPTRSLSGSGARYTGQKVHRVEELPECTVCDMGKESCRVGASGKPPCGEISLSPGCTCWWYAQRIKLCIPHMTGHLRKEASRVHWDSKREGNFRVHSKRSLPDKDKPLCAEERLVGRQPIDLLLSGASQSDRYRPASRQNIVLGGGDTPGAGRATLPDVRRW